MIIVQHRNDKSVKIKKLKVIGIMIKEKMISNTAIGSDIPSSNE